MTSICPHTLTPILQALPVAVVFSSQLLLTEKSSAALEFGLLERNEELLSIHATKLSIVLNDFLDLGWSHFGIND